MKMLQCQQRAAACMAPALGSSNLDLMQGSPAYKEHPCHLHLIHPQPFLQRAQFPAGTLRAHRYHVASFMGLLYETGLIPLVFVLPLVPKHPCAPAQCQGRAHSSALVLLCTSTPSLHSQVCAPSHTPDRQVPKHSAFSIVDSVCVRVYIYIYVSV